jgi:hypothetical protein
MLLLILNLTLTQLILIIYLIGAIIMYTWFRWPMRIADHTWGDMIMRVTLGLLSWISVLVILAIFFISFINSVDEKLTSPPPKWLRL